MSETATPEEARAHAAGAGGRRAPGTSRRSRPRRRRPARRVDPATVVWDETIGPGGYAARAARRGTRVRLTDRARRRVRERARVQRGSADRAAQRRRHGQGAVAGVPRRGFAAALRHGPRADVDHRRHVGRPRRDLRRVERDAQRREVRRAAACTVRLRTPATGSPSRWRSSGSTAATSCRTSTSSSACASTPTARCVSTTRSRAPGAYVELLAELPVIFVGREHAARARSACRVHGDRAAHHRVAGAPTDA